VRTGAAPAGRGHSAERRMVPPRVIIADGTLEALKWLGLVLMTLDHANKYLFGDKLPGAFELGRMAMPIFGFVLAYNLARPNALVAGVHLRVMKRLALYGSAATPFFIALGGLGWGWWPLNIMFMLSVAAGIVYLLEKGGLAGKAGVTVLFLLGGAMVEFWWFGLVFVLGAWWHSKTGSKAAVAVCTLALSALFVVNKNLWALAAVPLMLSAPLINLKTPRLRYAFYAYYPSHLAALWLLQKAT
jgi:hypothetical protein